MAHAENEIEINKPVGEVYAFLADGLNNLKWRSGVVSIELASGEVGEVGSEYKQILKGPGGRNIPGDYRVTTATPDSELSFVVIAGPARPTGNYFFAATPAGTKVRFVLDYQPVGVARLLTPMIQKTMVHEVAQLTRLKEVLES